jgi:hypothetical protein
MCHGMPFLADAPLCENPVIAGSKTTIGDVAAKSDAFSASLRRICVASVALPLSCRRQLV